MTVLKTQITVPVKWETKIVEVGDGSYDGVLELPEALLTQLGWKVGGELTMVMAGPGELILTKKK